MRMLRGTIGAPQFNILKAYSLFILSSITPESQEIIKEAIKELKIGVNNWNDIESDTFNFAKFFLRFRENLRRHIGEIPDEFFSDIADDFYTTKNLKWLKNFNNKFFKDI